MLTARKNPKLDCISPAAYRDHVSPFLAGLGLGLSLIVAIGAQNAYLLRQGLRREHVTAVVIVCTVSDITLYVVGATGFGAVAARAPWLIDVVRWVGAAFVIGYGLLAARRALRPDGSALQAAAEESDADGVDAVAGGVRDIGDIGDGTVAGNGAAAGGTRSWKSGAPIRGTDVQGRRASSGPGTRTATGVVLTALALTWLNPHVYLDTVFLAGSVAATQGQGRWLFVLGASVASTLWFTALGYGARGLGRWLGSPRSWRVLDGAIAAVMVAIGISLIA